MATELEGFSKQFQGRLQPPAAQGAPRHSAMLLKKRAAVAFLLRFVLRRRAGLHPCASISNSSKRLAETGSGAGGQTPVPSFPALNGGACRTTGYSKEKERLQPLFSQIRLLRLRIQTSFRVRPWIRDHRPRLPAPVRSLQPPWRRRRGRGKVQCLPRCRHYCSEQRRL